MISPETLRRYAFFAGFDPDQLRALAMIASEETFEENEVIFREGDPLDRLYLLLEGEVTIGFEVPDRSTSPPVADQLLGDLETQALVVSVLVAGEVFGWSALTASHQSTATVATRTACRIVGLDASALRERFESDPEMGYTMMKRVAEVARERLRAARMETLITKKQ